MRLIRNAVTINTSPDVRPSIVPHTLRGADVYILRPDLNRCGDAEIAAALTCPKCETTLKMKSMSPSQESGKYKILFRASGRPALAVEAH